MHTMGRILENWRVLGAMFFAVVFIVGAFMLARSVESPSVAQASTETALLQAIATRDTDGDGLPDWEEALYGTSPNLTDTFRLGMTDGAAVAKGLIVPKAIANVTVATSSPDGSTVVDPSLPPAPAEGTITTAFAESFFTLYLAAKQAAGGADLSEGQMNDVASHALSSLSSIIVAAPDYKSARDIAVSGSGADALTSFAVSAEAVLLKNTSSAAKSEMYYLRDAVEDGDTSALVHISSIAKAYRDSAAGLAVLPVPRELAAVHLALVNALMRTSQIADDFTRVNIDPLATILALKQYPQAVLALGEAFAHVGRTYAAAGISLPAGAPGASFVNLIVDVAAKQKAAKKP